MQLPSRIWAICGFVGGRFCVAPNGDIIVDIALFSLLGVLLKLNARPTLALVRDANLEKNVIWKFFYNSIERLLKQNIKTFFPSLELIIVKSFAYVTYNDIWLYGDKVYFIWRKKSLRTNRKTCVICKIYKHIVILRKLVQADRISPVTIQRKYKIYMQSFLKQCNKLQFNQTHSN